MRQYLLKENGIARRVIDAKSRDEAKQRTGLLTTGYVRVDALPPSAWTQTDCHDVAMLTSVVMAHCNVCGKKLGEREQQHAMNAYCGCCGGDPQ